MHIIVNNICAPRAECERARPSVPPFHPSAVGLSDFLYFVYAFLPPINRRAGLCMISLSDSQSAAEEDAADLGIN
jgi:hypothetical protein